MSISEQIAVLEELASIDEQIRLSEEDLAKRQGSLEGMRGDLAGLEERITSHQASLQTMDRTRGELQVEVRQMSQQIDHSREKLQRSRNERESMAAQRELEELRKLIRDREDEMRKLSDLSEQAKESLSTAEGERTKITDELAGSVDGETASIEQLRSQATELAEKRKEASKRIPPVLFRKYETIRKRRQPAIASTTDGTCNACHIGVPPMLFQQLLRREEILTCPHCQRILYYTPKKAAEADSPKAAKGGKKAAAAADDAGEVEPGSAENPSEEKS